MGGYQSWASSPNARLTMRRNRSRDTKPEWAVRRLLHAAGLRYRVAFRPLPGVRRTADIVFTRQRIAIFIDGCFWHGCPEHQGPLPKANASYWSAKLTRNVERDAETTTLLTDAGWSVLRYWEHEPAAEVAEEIIAAVRAANARSGP